MDTFLLILIALLAGTGVWAWHEQRERGTRQEKDTAEKIDALRTELLQRQDGLKGYITMLDHRTQRSPAQPLPAAPVTYTPPAIDRNSRAPGIYIDALPNGSSSSPPSTPQAKTTARHREDPLLTEPLTLPNGLTVRSLISHYSLGPSWPELVVAFYAEAGGDPVIGPYFFRTDMTALRKHFADAIVLVCEKGVRQSTVDAMRDAHRQVVDPHGVPITGDVYDRVIDTLAGLLLQWNVPEEIVVDLARVVAPLRAAIVQREAEVEA